MDELYMGREAWRNPDMAISDVRVWLRDLPIGAPELEFMLSKVAQGEYPKLRGALTDVVLAICRSNHKNSSDALANFFKSLDGQMFALIDLRMVPKKFGNFILECRRDR